MVYSLEGTSETRRLIAAVAISNVMVLLLRLLLAHRLEISQVDLTQYGRDRWLDPSVRGCIISTVSLIIDGFLIIVIYQTLINRLPRMPYFISLSLALLGALAAACGLTRFLM